MIVILTSIQKNKPTPLSLLKFENFSRRSCLFDKPLEVPVYYSVGFKKPFDSFIPHPSEINSLNSKKIETKQEFSRLVIKYIK